MRSHPPRPFACSDASHRVDGSTERQQLRVRLAESQTRREASAHPHWLAAMAGPSVRRRKICPTGRNARRTRAWVAANQSSDRSTRHLGRRLHVAGAATDRASPCRCRFHVGRVLARTHESSDGATHTSRGPASMRSMSRETNRKTGWWGGPASSRSATASRSSAVRGGVTARMRSC